MADDSDLVDAALAARRLWLFEVPRGSWRGIDLDVLDASDPADREMLVRAEHPELDAEDADDGEDGEDGAGSMVHLALHDVVATRLWDGEPPEMGATADRLRALGYERHDILHMLGSVTLEEIRRVAAGEEPVSDAERASLLEALPESWEAMGPAADDDADDWDDDADDGADDWDEDDELLVDAHRLLAERGPLSLDALAEALGADEEEVEALAADPALVFVGGGCLASAYVLADGVTISHRLSSWEAGERLVEVFPGLSLLEAFTCGDGHLHFAEPHTAATAAAELREVAGHGRCLSLDDIGVPSAPEGTVIGFTLDAAGVAAGNGDGLATVAARVLEAAPTVTEIHVARLRASFEGLASCDDQGHRMPVAPIQLLCQLVLDAPALAAEPLPPFDELLDAAGFEVRHGHTAPAGTDWAVFERARALATVASRRGLGIAEARVLTVLAEGVVRAGPGADQESRPDKESSHALAHVLCDSEIAEAFAEVHAHDPAPARAFLRMLRQAEGRRHEAGLWWCESLVAGRAGDVDAAEACLRAAVASDPELEPALADAAWYASDRGDAAAAARLLERAGDEDEGRIALLRRVAASGAPARQAGRNDPCPCGSGRKYKQCCLSRPGLAPPLPLESRVRWVWEKMRWWLERFGPVEDMLGLAVLLEGTLGAHRSALRAASLNLDLAASLVLFADGAVAGFIAERGPLLPVDEANLAAQWSLGGPSVHEVGQVRPGSGFSLRDLRTGDEVEVHERAGSRSLHDGDLVFAHPVFDGTGYQIVGGLVLVTLSQRGPLMALLDEGAGAWALADELVRARRMPTLVNAEGEPTVLCQGTYRITDAASAAAGLDASLERHGDDHWAEMVEHDGQRVVRATATIEGGTLTLSANSEVRFARIKQTVTEALGTLEAIEETHEPVADAWRRHLGDRARATGPRATGAPTGVEPSALPPEVAAAMTQLLREREVAWLDEPVPALGGLTPREAADDPTRREDLFALLHEYERTVVPEGAVSYDVSRLRQLLGLATP